MHPNQPPSVAFPRLPPLPQLPAEVDPDRWLADAQGRVYRRHVNSSGTIQIDRHTYAVGTAYAKRQVLVHVDAKQQMFRVTLDGRVLKTLPIQGVYGTRLGFGDYLKIIQAEARTVEQHHTLLCERMGDR
jgi:hypothetical protein